MEKFAKELLEKNDQLALQKPKSIAAEEVTQPESEKKYIASNGYAYTKQQLIDANYTEEDIKSLKTQ